MCIFSTPQLSVLLKYPLLAVFIIHVHSLHIVWCAIISLEQNKSSSPTVKFNLILFISDLMHRHSYTKYTQIHMLKQVEAGSLFNFDYFILSIRCFTFQTFALMVIFESVRHSLKALWKTLFYCQQNPRNRLKPTMLLSISLILPITEDICYAEDIKTYKYCILFHSISEEFFLRYVQQHVWAN